MWQTSLSFYQLSVKRVVPKKGAEDLKEDALTRKVRLACKLPPDFVKWLQEYYAQMKSERREETYGEKHTYNAHFLKMNSLHEVEAPNLVEFLSSSMG